jgi:hypothetical protein
VCNIERDRLTVCLWIFVECMDFVLVHVCLLCTGIVIVLVRFSLLHVCE